MRPSTPWLWLAALAVALANTWILLHHQREGAERPGDWERIPEIAGSPYDPYSDATRDSWNKPEEVMDALGIQRGSVVADIGCGYGYFTEKLAARVGPTGRVYAQDVDLAALSFVKSRVRAAGLDPVVLVWGLDHDVRLRPGTLDGALMVDVYHGILFRGARPDLEARDGGKRSPDWYFRVNQVPRVMDSLKAALKPGGWLAVLDRDARSQADFAGAVPREALVAQLASCGWKLDGQWDFLPRHYFLRFRPVPAAGAGAASAR